MDFGFFNSPPSTPLFSVSAFSTPADITRDEDLPLLSIREAEIRYGINEQFERDMDDIIASIAPKNNLRSTVDESITPPGACVSEWLVSYQKVLNDWKYNRDMEKDVTNNISFPYTF